MTPVAVISRLARYLTYAQSLRKEAVGWVSSRQMAEALDVTDATVRRDLACVGLGGVTNRGYEVEGVCGGLLGFLGADEGWNTVVVGAGNLGKALALHGELARRGFRVRGIFDADGRKVGTRVGALTVQPMAELPQSIVRRKVEIGIVAVPPDAAQSVADVMIISGIKGIFNLALTHVVAPSRVKVVEGRLISALIEIGYAIREKGGGTTRRARAAAAGGRKAAA
jgi:redox-sensing transcriptional repressor